MRNNGYGGPQAMHHQPSYNNQYNRSPPPSGYNSNEQSNSQHQSTGGYSAYGSSYESRSLSPGSNTMMDSVDRVASDLNHAIQTSQQGGQGRLSTPDHRMARAPTNASTTSNTSISDADKIRNEYEMRLAAMRKRIGQLESQMLDYRMNDSPDSKVDEVNNLEKLNHVLTQKNERLENDIKILRDQLVAAKAEVPALRSENETLKREKAQLVDRERELKRDLDDARAKIRKYKTTSVFARDHHETDLEPPPKLMMSEGAIRKSSVLGFQEAVDKMLLATRSDNVDGDLALAASSVKRACGELRADVHAYEAAHDEDPGRWPMVSNVRHNLLPQTMESFEQNLSSLEIAISNHLDSMGVSPVSLLETAASHLTTSVVSLVKMLKVCRSDDRAPPRLPGQDISITQKMDMLRLNLEDKTDTIVEGIQTMLRIVRATNPDPSTLFGTLQSVINSARTIIDACAPAFGEIDQSPELAAHMQNTAYDSAKARQVLEGLESGHLQLNDQLNDIVEAQDLADDNQLDNPIVTELLGDTAFKQRLTSAVFDVAKYTKMLMALMD
ncbi:component of the polarisome [Linderina macrospora]|uniref:Component of the polarisome n=1 Tax=Linderina macrospora TaxID=4868 RepID=A0ACC1J9Z6_9FUNG|nr:component of the polarisome [Linderina macrospora]